MSHKQLHKALPQQLTESYSWCVSLDFCFRVDRLCVFFSGVFLNVSSFTQIVCWQNGSIWQKHKKRSHWLLCRRFNLDFVQCVMGYTQRFTTTEQKVALRSAWVQSLWSRLWVVFFPSVLFLTCIPACRHAWLPQHFCFSSTNMSCNWPPLTFLSFSRPSLSRPTFLFFLFSPFCLFLSHSVLYEACPTTVNSHPAAASSLRISSFYKDQTLLLGPIWIVVNDLIT